MNASPTPSTTSSPASPIWLSVSPPNAGTNSPSISAWVAFPPAPWAIVMCGSRNLARLLRTFSIRPSTCCSRSDTAP